MKDFQLYDFEFFIANNGTERPNRNRKVENLPFSVGNLSGVGPLYET